MKYKAIPKDYVEYVSMGVSTDLSIVQTDFFNIDEITKRVNIDSLEGLNFNMSISEISSKMNIQSTAFEKKSVQHLLINDVQISKNCNLSFFLLGTPYSTDFTYNPSYNPEGFAYLLKFSGNGIGKQNQIKSLIETSLNKNYTKVQEKSNDDISVFSSQTQNLTIANQNSNLLIMITQTSKAEEPNANILNDSKIPSKLEIIGKDIWIRNAPKTGDVVMKLNSGDVCKIVEIGIEETIKVKTDFWYKIEFNGKTGWVFGSQTSIKKQ